MDVTNYGHNITADEKEATACDGDCSDENGFQLSRGGIGKHGVIRVWTLAAIVGQRNGAEKKEGNRNAETNGLDEAKGGGRSFFMFGNRKEERYYSEAEKDEGAYG